MKFCKYISEEEIQAKIEYLANVLNDYIKDDEVVLIANLKGSIMFFSDLLKKIKSNNVIIDFISTESYKGTESTGTIRITMDLSLDIKSKRVILIEDILDTGLTMSYIFRYLRDVHEPSDIKLCVLLDKPARRKCNIYPDYYGFQIEDKFVIGYGLDYNEKYRNLPYIAIVEEI